MLSQELEQLIQYALADGVVTDKERAVLMRKAQEAGADMDEFEMILDAKIHEAQKQAAAQAPSPKPNNKHGEVRKCPACGAMVSAFTMTCPECGHEFSNVEAVKSANTLFEKLQALEMEKSRELAKHEELKNQQLQQLSARHNSGGAGVKLVQAAFKSESQQEERNDLIASLERDAHTIERKYLDAKLNLIKTYTVPNTKADLLELLSMASSNAYDNDGVVGPEEEVWLQKTDQVYQKIVICAADDTTTLNQATNMIASLIKRLPAKYKNFTRIPKELHDKINTELKAQKDDQKEVFKQNAISVIKGWRGIAFAVSLLIFLIGLIFNFEALGFILLIVTGILLYKGIKKAKEDSKKDLLYN